MKRRKKRKDQKKERIKIELNSQKKKYQIIAFVCLLGNYNEVVINYKKQRTKQRLFLKTSSMEK